MRRPPFPPWDAAAAGVTSLGAAALVVIAWFVLGPGTPAGLVLGLAGLLLAALAPYLLVWTRLRRQRDDARRDEQQLAWVSNQRDELEVERRELQRLALYDPVTEMGNRSLLQSRGEELGATLTEASLLLLDLGIRHST